MGDAEPKLTREAKKVRGKPFQKGRSGNPKGKLPGTRNGSTLAVRG